ncbi:MAG: uL15 family ribosomal protein [Candidatus Parcubacteria bacterium]|nr:uL15 family ribosomal protein [Candidatus Parcubacteria bacterium]
MQIHTLTTEHKNKESQRIGRGGKRGTYSGKGQKGQKSRAGAKFRNIQKELILKQPKRRGEKFKSLQTKPTLVALSVIVKNYKAGEKVSPKTLVNKGLIRAIGKKLPHVKILGKVELTNKLVIEKCICSKTAAESILRAGGSIT